MDNNFTLKNGFTMLEMTVVMVIAVVLLAVIIRSSMNFENQAKFQATVREMGSIAQASIDYYNSSSNDPALLTWPTNVSNLVPMYMPQAITSSPLGGNYQLSFANEMVTVSTVIPKGILTDSTEGSFLNIAHGASGDRVSISQSVSNGFSGRLFYDLKHLYKE
jgi:prepilin-type N-terminal cleavage/methylation domain-containing protein